MRCSFENGHFFVETVITVDDNQLTVRMTMYDPELQVVNSGLSTEEMTVNWIKQQEVTNVQNTARDGSKTEVTHTGLEKHPLKWEIPHHLLENIFVKQPLKCGLKICCNTTVTYFRP